VLDEKNHPMPVKSISARFNLSDGSSKVEPLNKKGNIPWILPTDESVDLALIPLLPDQKAVDYLSIPVDDFATDDIIASRDISEGTKIVFTVFLSISR